MKNFKSMTLASLLINFVSEPSPKKQFISDTGLQLAPIKIDEEYAKYWNEKSTDFVVLVDKDGNRLNDSIYRKGGMFYDEKMNNDYFMLLKYIEAYYDDNITKDKNKKRHLKHQDTIIDKYGKEIITFTGEGLRYVNLIKNSVIYSYGSEFFNIKTGESYGSSNKQFESDDFLFIELGLLGNNKKTGILKIHKKTGESELFPRTKM